MTNADLFLALQQWVDANYAGLLAVELTVMLSSGKRARLPVPVPSPGPPQAELFVPNAVQKAILAALDGKALKTKALGEIVGDSARVFRRRGGMQELRDHGLVKHHSRLGFYRPDAPPPELEGGSSGGS